MNWCKLPDKHFRIGANTMLSILVNRIRTNTYLLPRSNSFAFRISEYIQNILLQLMLEYSIEITEQYRINRLRIAINFGCQWKRLCFHYKLAWNFPINFNSWFMVLKLAKNQLLLTPLFCWMNADNTQYPRSISHGFTSHKWEEHIRLHNLMVVRKAARCRWLFHQ